MSNFNQAWKFFKRELKHGDLSLLFLAIFIAIASLSSIGFLLKRIDSSMLNHAAQLNGAELLLKSPRAISEAWLKEAKLKGLKQAQMVSFPSMLVVDEQFKLAQIKAVSNNFPLLGKLMVKAGIGQNAENRQAPPIGKIWIDRRLFHFFQMPDGNLANPNIAKVAIELGEGNFQVNGILDSVPGQSSTFFSIAPTAIINLADLDQTATIQVGSRVNYIYFFSGPETSLKDYQSWLKDKLRPGQNLRYGVEGVRALSANLKKAGDFLSLAALLTVLLSAVAIAISSHRYGQHQFKNNAIMLCLGFTERQIISIELFKLVLLGLFASLLGVVVGYFTHLMLLQILSELIPKPLPEISLLPVWTGIGSGILLIITISMANLFRLKQLSPMAILRKDQVSPNINRYLLYGMSLLGLLILSWFYTQNYAITLLFYILTIGLIAILFSLAKLLIHGLLWLNQRYQFIHRLATINLRQHKRVALLQIATFSLIFALVLIIYLSRTDLLNQWQQQLPPDTPNHFVINIQSYEADEFRQMLSNETSQADGIFPMVRGRLNWLNDKPIMEVVDAKKRTHNSLNRELNLSFAATMQPHNKLVKGKWWGSKLVSPNALPEISLESTMAKELGLKIGDKLGFQIGARQIHGVVSNLRAVRWDSFQPNFYIIFPPQVLEQFPVTYISSFHLAEQNKEFLNQLIQHFPGITIIEVDQILAEVQYIIEKMSVAIDFVFVFILLAGILVLAASLSSTLESRMYENAIIRTLGSSAKTLRNSLVVEFSVVAVLSTIIALIMAEGISAVLYQQIFNLSYILHPELWFIMLLIALLLIISMGLVFVNRIFTHSVSDSLNRFGG